jgi:glycosyltransferase involved in cell wall biosynthesis
MHRRQVDHLTSVILQRQIDVVYDRTFHMTLVSAKACRRAGVGRVSVIVSPPSHDFHKAKERFQWMKYRNLRSAYSDESAISVAVSQSVADDTADYFKLPLQSIFVLPNPVDMQRVQQCADDLESLPEQHGIPQSGRSPVGEGALRIAVIARLSPEKGHQRMLQAAKIWNDWRQQYPDWCLRPWRIDFVGDGRMRVELEQLAQNMGLGQQVHFQGYQANPYPWIAAADALCIPSDYEGLPNVALEAMVLMTPVVATPCSNALDQLFGQESQRGWLLPDYQPEGIAQAIRLLANQPNQTLEKVQAAYQWIDQHHSLDKWLDTMSGILSEAKLRAALKPRQPSRR